MRATLLLLPLLLSCAPNRCFDHEDCGWDEICAVDRCESAFDRPYQVTISRASVGATHPDGFAWDVDGTPPDLFVDFGTSSDVPCWTSVAIDEFAPVWEEYCDLWLADGATFYADVWDYDPEFDELATSFAWDDPHDVVALARSNGRVLRVVDATGSVALDLYWVPLY